MTVAEEIAKLRASVKALDSNKPLEIAAQTVHALRVLRIFDKEGVGGSYNTTKEIWVENTQLRRTNRGKSGKAEKTSYFKSYYDLKKAQGFNPDIVNMRLTNDLQSDFANSPMTKGTATPVGKVIKVNDTLYIEALRRSENVRKLKANIRRFGDFTRFTPDERTKFALVYDAEMNKLLRGIK